MCLSRRRHHYNDQQELNNRNGSSCCSLSSECAVNELSNRIPCQLSLSFHLENQATGARRGIMQLAGGRQIRFSRPNLRPDGTSGGDGSCLVLIMAIATGIPWLQDEALPDIGTFSSI